MRRIPAEQRASIAVGVIADAETLNCACDCARWLGAGDGTREPILTDEEEKQMQAALGMRIEAYLTAQPTAIWILEPKDAGKYLAWWERVSGPGPVGAYMSRQFQEDSASIFELMKSCLPTGWGMTTGLPIGSSFDRDIYNAISRVIDPAVVAAALQKIYGEEELAAPNYRLPLREPRERRLAHQFMFVCNKVLAEQAQILEPDNTEEAMRVRRGSTPCAVVQVHLQRTRYRIG